MPPGPLIAGVVDGPTSAVTDTVDWLRLSSTFAVFVPLSTVVTVSDPFLVTVTCGP